MISSLANLLNLEFNEVTSLREYIKNDDLEGFKTIFKKNFLKGYFNIPNYDSNAGFLDTEKKSLIKVLIDNQAEYMLKYLIFNGGEISQSDVKYSFESKRDLLKQVKFKFIFEIILGKKGYDIKNEDYSTLPKIVFIWNKKQSFFDYNLESYISKANFEIFKELKGYFRVKGDITDDHIFKKLVFYSNDLVINPNTEKILNRLYNQYLLIEDQNLISSIFKETENDPNLSLKLINEKFTSSIFPKNKETFWNGIKSILYELETFLKIGEMTIKKNFIMKILFTQNQDELDFHAYNLSQNLPFHPNILSPLKVIKIYHLKKETNLLYSLKDFPLKTSEDFSFLILIYPKCDQSLKDYLKNNALEKENTKEVQKRLHFSLEIIEGLSCLYEYRISHRDLVTENLLLFNDIPKIIDFEDSLFFKSENSPEKLKLKYAHPKFLKGPRYSILPKEIKEEVFSPKDNVILDYEKSDLYAFGFILYEFFDPNIFTHSHPIGCLSYYILKEFDKRPTVNTTVKILKYIEKENLNTIFFKPQLLYAEDGKIPEIIQFIMRRIIEIQEKKELNDGLFIESSSTNELNFCTLLINSDQSDLIEESLLLINLLKRIINNRPIIPRDFLGELFKYLDNDEMFINTICNMDLNNKVLLYEFLLFIFKIRKEIHVNDNKSLSRGLNFIFGYPRDNNIHLKSDIDQIIIVKKILDLNVKIMLKLKDENNEKFIQE